LAVFYSFFAKIGRILFFSKKNSQKIGKIDEIGDDNICLTITENVRKDVFKEKFIVFQQMISYN
jgi:hypothetical protein